MFSVKEREIKGTRKRSASSAAASDVFRARGPMMAITLSVSTNSRTKLLVISGFNCESRTTSSQESSNLLE